MIQVKSFKNFCDYYDFKIKDDFPVSYVGDTWARILTQKQKEVSITDDQFYAFTKYFLNQLPHNWDNKTFMGVKLKRETGKNEN